jgi:hypothetical protein
MSHEDNDYKPVVLIRKEHRINYVLNGMCEYYGITLDELRLAPQHGPVQKWTNRRRIAMKILYQIADCSLKDIPSPLGYSQNLMYNIGNHITILNEEMSNDTQAGKALLMEYNNILKHLNL